MIFPNESNDLEGDFILLTLTFLREEDTSLSEILFKAAGQDLIQNISPNNSLAIIDCQLHRIFWVKLKK